MYSPDDTIAAISTPPGEGGIGIVRLSGEDAIAIASRLFRSSKGKDLMTVRSHTILHGSIVDPATENPVDEVLVSVMRAPSTYTREDVVEINCHGGLLPLRKVLELTLREGARLAGPGEFTFRAFINGRIDLSQAEATMDLIRAKTERSGRIALSQLSGGLSEMITRFRDQITEVVAVVEAYIDFPEEEIELDLMEDLILKIEEVLRELGILSETYEEGRFFREGLGVAIVGRPNVGKSSLLNALIREERAIVTEIPGTTRDVIEESLSLKGIPLRIMDTAGIRQTHDLAEREGVARSLRAIEGADLVLAVFDLSEPLHSEDQEVLRKVQDRRALLVLNKRDLPARLATDELPEGVPSVRISAKTGEGLEELREKMEALVLGNRSLDEGIMITNLRHKNAVDIAIEGLERGVKAMRENAPLEIVSIELREALQSLGEIVGEVSTEDILEHIFGRFCIGK